LEYKKEDVDALAERAEAYILSEQYQEAVSDYRAAVNIQNNNQKVIFIRVERLN